MRFARWVFLVSGVYGLLVVTPLFFLEERLGRDFPPPPNHPELYYGFTVTVLAWQLMYLLIGTDPARYRPAMLLAAGAKLGFATAVAILFGLDRVAAVTLGTVIPDAVLGLLFVVAWARIAPTKAKQ